MSNATVIGGGIGGLTAATALARRGWTVRLHERQPEIRAVGAGIYVWDNGLLALESIGAFDEATHGAHIGPAAEARSHRGKTLYRIDINGDGQARCYTLLREVLIRALVNAARDAGVELVTDSVATAVHANGTVDFDDGHTEVADLVVAADGVHSRLRDSLDLAYRRIRMTQGAARLMIPASPDYLSDEDRVKHLEVLPGPTPAAVHAVHPEVGLPRPGLRCGRSGHRRITRERRAVATQLPDAVSAARRHRRRTDPLGHFRVRAVVDVVPRRGGVSRRRRSCSTAVSGAGRRNGHDQRDRARHDGEPPRHRDPRCAQGLGTTHASGDRTNATHVVWHAVAQSHSRRRAGAAAVHGRPRTRFSDLHLSTARRQSAATSRWRRTA